MHFNFCYAVPPTHQVTYRPR